MHPDLIEEIRVDLENYPTLHLYIDEPDRVQIRGTFPVHSPEGNTLDEYRVTIELPSGYPRILPIVYETGGRIPWDAKWHVESDGKACVLLPDNRWYAFPENARFLEYLRGPLHNFFLGQSIVAGGGAWPFGEWEHGSGGVLQHCRELFKTTENAVILRFLYVLSRHELKTHWQCPCGSGRKIKKCCMYRLRDLQKKLPRPVAKEALARLGSGASPYDGPNRVR